MYIISFRDKKTKWLCQSKDRETHLQFFLKSIQVFLQSTTDSKSCAKE